MEITTVFETINSAALQESLFPLRAFFFLIFCFFMGFIIWALFNTSWLKLAWLYDLAEFFTMRPYGVKKMTKAWNEAVEKVASNDQKEYKPALVELDEDLDTILMRSGNKGKDLAERLDQFTEGSFPPLLRIMESHKICEEIKADSSYQLDIKEAKKMMAAYKEAFECLHAFN